MRRALWFCVASFACATPVTPEAPRPPQESATPSANERDAWVASIATTNERFWVEERAVLFARTATAGAFDVAPRITPGVRVELRLVSCELPPPGKRSAIRCRDGLSERPIANDDLFAPWLKTLEGCHDVQRTQSDAATRKAVARSIEASGRSGLEVEGEGAITVVEVVRPILSRERANECSGVKHRPCDPVSSWPTENVGYFYTRSYELVGPRGAGPLAYPYELTSAMIGFPIAGARRDGWFVPDAGFDRPKASGRLDRVLAYEPPDDDARLAAALYAASVAVEEEDDRASQLAQRFLDELARRPIAEVHFELRRHALISRDAMKLIASGLRSARRPCPKD